MKNKAFSFVEFLVVIATIGVFAALLIPAISAARNNSGEINPIQNKTSWPVKLIIVDHHQYVISGPNETGITHHFGCVCLQLAEKE